MNDVSNVVHLIPPPKTDSPPVHQWKNDAGDWRVMANNNSPEPSSLMGVDWAMCQVTNDKLPYWDEITWAMFDTAQRLTPGYSAKALRVSAAQNGVLGAPTEFYNDDCQALLPDEQFVLDFIADAQMYWDIDTITAKINKTDVIFTVGVNRSDIITQMSIKNASTSNRNISRIIKKAKNELLAIAVGEVYDIIAPHGSVAHTVYGTPQLIKSVKTLNGHTSDFEKCVIATHTP